MTVKRIYLDCASTTPLDPRVKKAMEPFFAKEFGNPSSIHFEGMKAKRALDSARAEVARSLEVHSDEIVFTSGGTEANNLALFGLLDTLSESQTLTKFGGQWHVVTTAIEHASVLEPIRELERQGRIGVTYVPVEPGGIVRPEKIIAAIRPRTVLVSVMYANNEIGTIQPIRRIGKMICDLRFKNSESRGRSLNAQRRTSNAVKNRLPIFHTDACQAPLYQRCLANALGVDLMTLDGHKMYGPKGVGCLYVRRGIKLSPRIIGGGQERGVRATTENVPGIVGFSEALKIAGEEREGESLRLIILRDFFYSQILENLRIERQAVILNGGIGRDERLPNNLNVSFPGVDTEFLALKLDAAGIACSTKSSCLKDERESYVVRALGGNVSRAGSTIRFTLGRNTTKRDILYAADTLVTLLRDLS